VGNLPHYRYRLGPRASGEIPSIKGIKVRIGEDARKCVVFFGTPTPGGGTAYGGTGFLVSFPHEEFTSHYVVTCRHVASRLDPGFFIRANTKSGEAENIPVDTIEWVYHPDPTVDVAVASLLIYDWHWERTYLPAALFFNAETDKYGGILCGDPISIVGLFRLHVGAKRNIPIVHTGNISALADHTERIPLKDRSTGKLTQVEGHLVEAQTLEGLSGSPVFIRRFIGMPFIKGARDESAIAYGEVDLLGMYQGAWDAEPGIILEADRNLQGKNMRIPLGMGIVVPGDKIMDVIEGKKFSDQRVKEAEEERLKKAATTDDAFPVAPSSGDNPKHR